MFSFFLYKTGKSINYAITLSHMRETLRGPITHSGIGNISIKALTATVRTVTRGLRTDMYRTDLVAFARDA